VQHFNEHQHIMHQQVINLFWGFQVIDLTLSQPGTSACSILILALILSLLT
jgi:hypothetical protein